MVFLPANNALPPSCFARKLENVVDPSAFELSVVDPKNTFLAAP
jgi:hypothetical protein